MTRHENRKRCERNFFGYSAISLCKDLAVRNHQCRRFFKVYKLLGELIFLDNNCLGIGVQNIPYSVHLGKNDSTLGCRCVNGNAKYDGIAFFDKIPKHGTVFESFRCCFDDKRAQIINAFFLQRADWDDFFSENFFQGSNPLGRIGNRFNLVGCEDVGRSQFFKLRN